ncbi:MAG: hypothetical protein ABR607_00590 [Pyrinomonadaceae bacterium]
MNPREDVIARALDKRQGEVRDRVTGLTPAAFGDFADYVQSLQQSNPNSTLQSSAAAQRDCLSSLRALSLSSSQFHQTAPALNSEAFLRLLEQHRSSSAERLRLLTERYVWPPNFSLIAEAEIREHSLSRLMVQDRAAIEKQSIARIDTDDLLLKLNLIAVHAAATSDLRFLDALNYYYELLPADWVPRARHGWLLASYLGLYARALAVQMSRNQNLCA